MKNDIKNGAIILLSFIVDMFIVYALYRIANFFTIYFTGDSCFTYGNLAIAEIMTAFFFYIFDLYASKEGSRENTLISVFLSSVASVVCGAILSVFVFERYTLVFTMMFSVGMIVCLSFWRLLFSFTLVRFREKNKILILESDSVPTRLARKLKYSHNNVNEAWYYIVDETVENELGYIIHELIPNYDTVFISSHLSKEFQDKVFEYCLLTNKTVNFLAIPSNVSLMNGRIYQFADTPVIEIGSIHLKKSQRFFKRAFDLFVSVIGLIISSPFFLIVPIFIKLDSPGPVFYTQERYTIGKKKFKLYKFRTMRTDAEKDGEMLATVNDSRITRVGNVLRKLRLDELPQFVNILSGSMSVVGPRPERPVFADEFCEKVKNYNLRYTMKAGLTGYAQIYGKYNTRVSDKILLDMIYAMKYSFWLDLKMVMLTIKTMFIKESTEGVDEEMEQVLSSSQREEERKRNNINHTSNKDAVKNDGFCNNSGV